MRIENGVPRGSLPLYCLTTTVTVAGACRGFSQAARNAIVFTINTACLPAQRGGAHYVVGAHYAVNCGRRRRGPQQQQQQQETRVSRGDQRHKNHRRQA